MRILLHTCCGVCASHCIRVLKDEGHAPVLFFSNSNIYPFEEYLSRRDAAKKIADIEQINFVEDIYDHASWQKDVACGFEQCKERGERCVRCFTYNLRRAYQAIEGNDCEAFTTTLTVSPHKHSPTILAISQAIGGDRFLPYNFKKQNGFLNSIRLAKIHELYQQSYCGCEYSRRHQTLGRP